ncbi:hypothetical protein H4R99_008122 [Coemansia sp. RSA 1722]|nr:hypothetical protein H4R99_008122 [Coemansia sp. RSA 1722]
MVTSTYVSGRRVIETGSLRVIFAPDFRIRVWAFSAADATICLPRKRPNSQDDALVRTAEATIARNLDWPNTDVPLPRRRKSAHGRQPPEECVLPPGALRHAEVASAMYGLQALIGLQLQNPAASVASLLDIWSAAENVAPQKQRSQKAASSGPPNERKRARKRSIAAPAAAGKEAAKSTAAPDTNKPSALAAKPPAASTVSAPVSAVKTGL